MRMPDRKLPINYPFQVHFIRKRCRIGETATVRADGVVIVNSANSADAPAAFQIERASPGPTMQFEVRHYDGSFWWPVADDKSFVAASDFERGLAQGRASYFGLLDADIVLSSRQQFANEDEFRKSVAQRLFDERLVYPVREPAPAKVTA
jgi:hypothetical protein